MNEKDLPSVLRLIAPSGAESSATAKGAKGPASTTKGRLAKGVKKSGQPKPEAKTTAAEPRTAPQQTIFSLGKVKKLEPLPRGILPEDLRRNDRSGPKSDGAKGKPHSGPQSGKLKHQPGELSKGQSTVILSQWLRPPGDTAAATTGAKKTSPAVHPPELDPPSTLVLANPHNLCYLNSLVQALMHRSVHGGPDARRPHRTSLEFAVEISTRLLLGGRHSHRSVMA